MSASRPTAALSGKVVLFRGREAPSRRARLISPDETPGPDGTPDSRPHAGALPCAGSCPDVRPPRRGAGVFTSDVNRRAYPTPRASRQDRAELRRSGRVDQWRGRGGSAGGIATGWLPRDRHSTKMRGLPRRVSWFEEFLQEGAHAVREEAMRSAGREAREEGRPRDGPSPQPRGPSGRAQREPRRIFRRASRATAIWSVRKGCRGSGTRRSGSISLTAVSVPYDGRERGRVGVTRRRG